MNHLGRSRGWAAACLVSGLWAALAWPAGVRAQDGQEGLRPAQGNGAGASGLIVNSVPAGAVVTLRGPYEWVGVTPWRLSRQVSGLYHVEARRPGYETYTSEVVLGAEGWQELNLKLSRRSTGKAFIRSLVLPGWGQAYRGSRTKGLLIFAGTIAAGATFAVFDTDYQSTLDDYDAARSRYERAVRLEDLDDRWAEVVRASNRADDKWDRRKIALGALGGIYAFNLLDVLFLGPGGEAASAGYSGREIPEPAGAGLACTASWEP
jgi:hypothetical protein